MDRCSNINHICLQFSEYKHGHALIAAVHNTLYFGKGAVLMKDHVSELGSPAVSVYEPDVICSGIQCVKKLFYLIPGFFLCKTVKIQFNERFTHAILLIHVLAGVGRKCPDQPYDSAYRKRQQETCDDVCGIMNPESDP